MTTEGAWWERDPILTGDFYEDCGYHPRLCVQADYTSAGDELLGISLVDGGIGSCSPRHCGPVRLSASEAIDRRVNWTAFVANELPRLTLRRDQPT